MKAASAPMISHLQQEVTTLCTCWRVERDDGEIFGFTDHDKDLVFGGVTYESQDGYNRSAISNDDSMGVANLDISGILASDRITDNDLRNGLFDFARVFVFVLNWANVSQGEIKLRRGWFGETTLSGNGMFHCELRGLAQALTYNFIEIFSPECRADFGDARCKKDLAPLRQTGTVVTVASRGDFTVSAGFALPSKGFVGGLAKFTSGENNGKSMEIIDYNDITKQVILFDRVPYPIAPGDTIVLTPACNKTRETCLFYNNVVNFRGEPDVPGQDEYLYYPDAN